MKRNTVFFCVEGFQHLEAAKVFARLFKEDGKDTAIYYPHDVDTDPLTEFDNRVTDILAVPGFLRYVCLMVTFTNETSPQCMRTNLFTYAAKRTNTAVIAIQHGWLQPGLNFDSGQKNVGFISGSDNSRAVSHFGKQVEWEGEDGIGYFGLTEGTEITLPKPRQDRYSALVCTNLNSTVFTREQAFQFWRCVSRLQDVFPYLRLYHRGHPAENSLAEFDALGMGDIARKMARSPTSPHPMSASLVGMDFAIVTPSTTALDCVGAGVPTFLFEEKSFIGKLDAFAGNLFRTHEDLIGLVRRLLGAAEYRKPTYPAFSPLKFTKIAYEAIRTTGEYVMSEEILMDYYHARRQIV